MYIPRDVEKTAFLKWLTSNDPRPLFVHGARQIGKTETVKHFAKNHFSHIDYINLLYDKVINFIDSKESVTIIDEMQIAPHLISSIKPLHSKMILISSHLITPPIDTYDTYMTGLTFKEFLIASNNNTLIDRIESHLSSLKQFPNEIHEQLLDIFYTYLFLGGYPEIILNYLNGYNHYYMLNNIFNNTIEEAINICKGAHYRAFLKRVYYNLPYIIQNHKETFDTPISNLINLAQKIHFFTAISNYHSPERKHIYPNDCGIANALTDQPQIAMESYVCSNLPKSTTYINNNTFLYKRTAIEVNTDFINPSKEIDRIIRVSTNNISKEDNILTIPLYAFSFLKFH